MDLEYLIPNPHFGQSAIERPEKIRVKIVSFLTPERVQVRDVQTGELLEVLYSTLESAPLLRASIRSPETLGTLGKDVGYRNIAPFLSARDLSSLTLTSRSLSDEFKPPLIDMKQKLCAFLDSPLLTILFHRRPNTFREYLQQVLWDTTRFYRLRLPNEHHYFLPFSKTLLYQFCYSGIIPCKTFKNRQDADASGFRRNSGNNLNFVEGYSVETRRKRFPFPYTGYYSLVQDPQTLGLKDEDEEGEDIYHPAFVDEERHILPAIRAELTKVFVIDASVFVHYGLPESQLRYFQDFLCDRLMKQLLTLALSNCNDLSGGKTYYSL